MVVNWRPIYGKPVAHNFGHKFDCGSAADSGTNYIARSHEYSGRTVHQISMKFGTNA